MDTLDSESFLQSVYGIAEEQSSGIQEEVLRKLKEIDNADTGELSGNEIKFAEDSARMICGEKSMQDSFLGVSDKNMLLPEGTRFFQRFFSLDFRDVLLFVVEQEPQVRTLNFSSSFFSYDETVFYKNYSGAYPKREKKTVHLAFPYMVFVVVLIENYPLLYVYYAKKPLTSFDDLVFQVNLPNVYSSKVCNWFDKFSREENTPAKKVAKILTNFWGSRFSTDGNEGYYSLQKSNKMFSSIWEWEKNSKENPLFILDVNWLGESQFRYRFGKLLASIIGSISLENLIRESRRSRIDSKIKSFSSELGNRIRGHLTNICSSLVPRQEFPKLLEESLALRLSSGENLQGDSVKESEKKNEIVKGSRVKLRKDSEYYYLVPDISGEVISDFDYLYGGEIWARVKFDNGYDEYRFRRKDLELVE